MSVPLPQSPRFYHRFLMSFSALKIAVCTDETGKFCSISLRFLLPFTAFIRCKHLAVKTKTQQIYHCINPIRLHAFMNGHPFCLIRKQPADNATKKHHICRKFAPEIIGIPCFFFRKKFFQTLLLSVVCYSIHNASCSRSSCRKIPSMLSVHPLNRPFSITAL